MSASTPLPTHRRLQVVAALGLVTAAAGILAACDSGGTATSKPSAAAASSAPVVPATIAPTSPQHPIPSDNQIVETPALRETILLTGCAATDGGWAGTGTAKNPDKQDETYQVLVFFTDKYSRTIDSASTEVKVPAGKTATWSASASFSPPAGTQCVLRGLSKV